MKDKLKKIKKKLKITSLAAITGMTLMSSEIDNINNIDDDDDDNLNVSFVSEASYERGFVKSISYILKSVLVIPLWTIGSLIIKLLEPFKNIALSFIVTFLILCLIVLLIVKLLFPKMKLKNIFTLKNIIIILISSILINIVKYLILFKHNEYIKYSLLIYLIIGLTCIYFVLKPFVIVARNISKTFNSLY